MPLPDSNIFALNNNVHCLCSIVRNKTSNPMWVLVPKHGTTLAPNGQFVFIGDVSTWLQRRSYYVRDSFLGGLTSNKIEIIQTPVPHIFRDDGSNLIVKIIALNATNNVVSANPCWSS